MNYYIIWSIKAWINKYILLSIKIKNFILFIEKIDYKKKKNKSKLLILV